MTLGTVLTVIVTVAGRAASSASISGRNTSFVVVNRAEIFGYRRKKNVKTCT
jgi:hypothetical protein